MAADGSRWQLLGRVPSRLAPRGAIGGDFLGMAEEAQFDFRNLLIVHCLVSSQSAASPTTLIQQSSCRTNYRNVGEATIYCKFCPVRFIMLQRVESSRPDIARARIYTHTTSLHALCRFVKLGIMRNLRRPSRLLGSEAIFQTCNESAE
jgi:hypothetical protein